MNFKKIVRGFSGIKDLYLLSGDLSSFLKLFFLYVWTHPTLWTRRHTFPVEVSVKSSVGKCDIKIQDSTDLATIKTVFIEEEYSSFGLKDVKVILDLGGYIGETALYYSLAYPDAQIYVFEPNPVSYERLTHNVSGYKNIHTYNSAVSGQDNEKLEFFTNLDHSVGSSIVSGNCTNGGKISVQSMSLDSIFKHLKINSIDILKFDIEGAEYEVFDKSNKLSQIRTVIGEVHFDLMSQNRDDFISLFKKHSAVLEPHKSPNRFTLRAIVK